MPIRSIALVAVLGVTPLAAQESTLRPLAGPVPPPMPSVIYDENDHNRTSFHDCANTLPTVPFCTTH